MSILSKGKAELYKMSHGNAPGELWKPEGRGMGIDFCLGEQEEFPSQKSGMQFACSVTTKCHCCPNIFFYLVP